MGKRLTLLDLFKRACGKTEPQTDQEVIKKFYKLLRYPIEDNNNSEDDQKQEGEDIANKDHEPNKQN